MQELKVKEVKEFDHAVEVKFEQQVADVQILVSDIKEKGAEAVLEKYKDEPWFKKSGLESKVRKHEEKKTEDKKHAEPKVKGGKASTKEEPSTDGGGESGAPDLTNASPALGEGQNIGRNIPHSEV